MSIESMADVLKNAKYIMYCGMSLTEHADRIAKVLVEARQRSKNMTRQNDKDSPVLEFMDWTNPDPAYDHKNGTGDLEGSIALSKAMSTSLSQRIWKVTGVSYLDVAGQVSTMCCN